MTKTVANLAASERKLAELRHMLHTYLRIHPAKVAVERLTAAMEATKILGVEAQLLAAIGYQHMIVSVGEQAIEDSP